MESRNYTYESKWVGGTEYFRIIGLDGNEVARTKIKENAELIVAALNGIAP